MNLIYNEKTIDNNYLQPKELISMACIELRLNENDVFITILSTEWIKAASGNLDKPENILSNYKFGLKKYSNIDMDKYFLILLEH